MASAFRAASGAGPLPRELSQAEAAEPSSGHTPVLFSRVAPGPGGPSPCPGGPPGRARPHDPVGWADPAHLGQSWLWGQRTPLAGTRATPRAQAHPELVHKGELTAQTKGLGLPRGTPTETQSRRDDSGLHTGEAVLPAGGILSGLLSYEE